MSRSVVVTLFLLTAVHRAVLSQPLRLFLPRLLGRFDDVRLRSDRTDNVRIDGNNPIQPLPLFLLENGGKWLLIALVLVDDAFDDVADNRALLGRLAQPAARLGRVRAGNDAPNALPVGR